MTPQNPDLTLTAEDYSLLTDLYQLTMVACYTGEGLAERPAVFELLSGAYLMPLVT